MNNIYAHIQARLGNQLFIIFTTLSYYIDNKCKDYILCAYYSEARDYFWDTLFSNISQNVSYNTSIPEKYKEPFFHYKELPIFNNQKKDEYTKTIKYNFDNIRNLIINFNKNIRRLLVLMLKLMKYY